MDYIAEIEGDYYEGTQVKLRLMTPPPVILRFRFLNEASGQLEGIFVEDYFNSATRIRRGRLYRPSDYKSWLAESVYPPPKSTVQGPNGVSLAPVNPSYSSHGVQNLRRNSVVVLGDGASESHWLAVMSERIISYGLVVTLKAKTFLGVLPDVNPEAIPKGNRPAILQALSVVVNAASIGMPESVVDACRNTASYMITAQFPQSNEGGKKDLGKLVTWLIEQGRVKQCTDAADSLLYLMEASTSHLVNRLHSRGKANAAAQHGTRPLSLEDANLAVSAIAFLLQDFGWAESREY